MILGTSIDWMELSIQWMLTCGHFLWQGFVVAMVFIVLQRLAAIFTPSNRQDSNLASPARSISAAIIKCQRSASVNYVLACGAFLALPACVILTFAVVHSTRGSVLNAVSISNDNETDGSNSPKITVPTIERDKPSVNPSNGPLFPQTVTVASDQTTRPQVATPEPAQPSQRASFMAPLLSVAYAVVVGLLLLRLSLSLFGNTQLRSAAQKVTDPRLLEIVLAQAKRLKLKTVPIVAVCMRVSAPVVVGVLRPMILLPPSLLCGLEPTQLAAILSHEMAHIRRYDLLVNLIQRLVESLLFFHPVTWWISRRVTIERENCCDDLAASFVGRLPYATALVQMASICLAKHRSRNQALATLAADGGNSTDFGYRIRRLIDAQESPQIRITRRTFAIGLVTLGVIWASLVTLAQSPQTNKDEPPMEKPSQAQLVDGIQWSTWGDRDGIMSGARLILPEGGVKPGQPAVVEYRLKNVSTETKKFFCYVRSNWQYITLGTRNRISDMGTDLPEKPIEITIEPGKEFVATSQRATIDTRGLSPGDYQVALGSAFYTPDASNSGSKQEIPHRGSIPLKILGDSNAANARPLDKSIHWGDAILGLRLGAKFHHKSNNFSIGDLAEADLWIANVTNRAIECSIRLPHPLDGWLFNVENKLGDTIMLERPPLISIFSPQEFYSLKLAPGEIKVLTGERIEGQPDKFAGRRAKFEIVNKNEGQGWGDHTIKGRLVTQGGDYSAIYNVMLERPDVPGLRIELDTGNCSFTVGQPNADPREARVLDEATDKSILWGKPSGGLRLGIRQSEFARQRSILRHGEHLDYEVWIKNETDEVVQIARDPRDLQNPRLMNDQTINVIGNGGWLSFGIPPEELAKAELILPPGQAARRFLSPYHSASIRPPGSLRGRYGSEPLLLKPGKYPVYAQVGELKSGVEEVEIIPAARLQLRKSGRVTDKKREYAAEDPSEAILAWQTGNGEKQEAMINWDHGVMVDERDLASVEIVPVDGQPDQFSIALKLRPESASWLSRRIAMYSLWDDPKMVAILLDDKPLGAIHIPSPIPDDKLIVPVHFSRKQAEATIKEIQAAMAIDQAQHKATEPSTKAASQP